MKLNEIHENEKMNLERSMGGKMDGRCQFRMRNESSIISLVNSERQGR